MSAIRINVILFGVGNIGSKLINQFLESQKFFLEKRNIELRFPVITNSTLAFFEKDGLLNEWETDFTKSAVPYTLENIIEYAQEQQLENLIAVDATDSGSLIKNYIPLIQNGFDIVAANKNANTLHTDFYNELRRNLKKFDKDFLYETSIIAGLPVISTIRDLYLSGEEITKIRGVFSGALSYIFNRYSAEEIAFSTILDEAEKLGLTKTDSRDDLSGAEVAAKTIILARELGLDAEFTDVSIDSLLLSELRPALTKNEYSAHKKLLDKPYLIAKLTQASHHVLRYVGEINVAEKTLQTKLISVPESSALGQLKEAGSLIEIYTKSHGKTPIVIQGTGTDDNVTARGVLTDILKIAEKIKHREAIWA